MPYLIESVEWRLLHGLGLLLKLRPGPPMGHQRGSLQADTFEAALREVFIARELSQNLDQADFDHCQTNLEKLCSQLEDISKSPYTPEGRVVQVYPRLSSLIKSLATNPRVVDLASGPGETLFELPQIGDELTRCISVVTDFNKVFARLWPLNAQEWRIPPPQTEHRKNIWKKGRVRKHAIGVLETLFQYFRCGTTHEVFIKLTEDSDQDPILPSLQIAFPLCLDSKFLQEAWCFSPDQLTSKVSRIPDICTALRQHAGQGKALMLLTAECRLFGTWETPSPPSEVFLSKESLYELLRKGNLDLLTERPVSFPERFKIRKRELAVKLGFCLMDFFDADLNSKQFFFLNSSNPNTTGEGLYLSFTSKLPTTLNPYIFRIGHPTLLCFAKLLLEIYLGRYIDAVISPKCRENSGACFTLLSLLEELEYERDDPYHDAIRGCFVVQHEISKALKSSGSKGTDADAEIRRALYERIVKNLEDGLSDSISRLGRKRRRPESPPLPDHSDFTQIDELQVMTPRRKRQLTSRPLSSAGGLDDVRTPSVTDEAPGSVNDSRTTIAGSYAWFAELANMNAVVRIKHGERDHLSPRIKIAILDTGIENQHSDGVEEYYDFVEDRNVPCRDSSGHGTNIFQLLRKVSEDAEFFVGRVWEDNRGTTRTPELVRKAIDHAREVWRVDIILLPSGFRSEHEGIGEAIDRANLKKILIFASPSNYGNAREIYYPGRLYGHGKVICLFSTNSRVKSSTTKTFNPSPLKNASHRSFAILGEDIVLENTSELLNGTSYSTTIGAGIAARILDFSRHPRLRSRIKNVDNFRKVEGMLAVFGRMAKSTDNGYRCMAPWDICPPAEEGLGRREVLESQQAAVFDELKEALKNIYIA